MDDDETRIPELTIDSGQARGRVSEYVKIGTMQLVDYENASVTEEISTDEPSQNTEHQEYEYDYAYGDYAMFNVAESDEDGMLNQNENDEYQMVSRDENDNDFYQLIADDAVLEDRIEDEAQEVIGQFNDLNKLPHDILLGFDEPAEKSGQVPVFPDDFWQPGKKVVYFVPHLAETTRQLTTDTLGVWSKPGQSSRLKKFWLNRDYRGTRQENEKAFLVTKYESWSQSSVPTRSLRRIIWRAYDMHSYPMGNAIIYYEATPDFIRIEARKHGNAKRRSNPYQRKFPSVHQEILHKRQATCPKQILEAAARHQRVDPDPRRNCSENMVWEQSRRGGEKYGTSAKASTDLTYILSVFYKDKSFLRAIDPDPESFRLFLISDSMLESLVLSSLRPQDVIEKEITYRKPPDGLNNDQLFDFYGQLNQSGISPIYIDMTFNFDKYYLTVLVTRHKMIRKTTRSLSNAVFYAAFFVTSRKRKSDYQWMARSLRQELEARGYHGYKAMTIVSDSEEALSGFLEDPLFSAPAIHIGCELHLRRNVEEALKGILEPQTVAALNSAIFGTFSDCTGQRIKTPGIIDLMDETQFHDEIVSVIEDRVPEDQRGKVARYLKPKARQMWKVYNLRSRLQADFGFNRVTTNIVENGHARLFKLLKKSPLHILLSELRAITDGEFDCLALSIVGQDQYTLGDRYRHMAMTRSEYEKLDPGAKRAALKLLGIVATDVTESIEVLEFGPNLKMITTTAERGQLSVDAHELAKDTKNFAALKPPMFTVQDKEEVLIINRHLATCTCGKFAKDRYCHHYFALGLHLNDVKYALSQIENKILSQDVNASFNNGLPKASGSKGNLRRIGTKKTANDIPRSVVKLEPSRQRKRPAEHHQEEGSTKEQGQHVELPPFPQIDPNVAPDAWNMPYHNAEKFLFHFVDYEIMHNRSRCMSCRKYLSDRAPDNLILKHKERFEYPVGNTMRWSNNLANRFVHARLGCLTNRYNYVSAGGDIFEMSRVVHQRLTQPHRVQIKNELSYDLP